MSGTLTAARFIARLEPLRTESELEKLPKFFKGEDGRTRAYGVRFGEVFNAAKEFMAMPLPEIHRLLDSDYYEIRMGAVSIMDYQARAKNTGPERKQELFDLYLDRHDRLNNWDFVDRGAVHIIGEFLVDKPRDILYRLARSRDVWERRTAMVATHAFIKRRELDDTFRIAEILLHDPQELIHKAVGSWLREAGKKDQERLRDFLQVHAAAMPRVALRYAFEKMSTAEKEHFLGLRS